ncbi:Maf family protein [Candidatus Babeliales bacterium]|nr:Maf family protein [Candidatus Babeliales bacterium]
MNKLLLGSSSKSRQMLLNEALIPFIMIGHTADEDKVDKSLPFKELLQAIARYKMDHVELPLGKEGDSIFVLTADSMGMDGNGVVHGKPKDKEDAIHKIKALEKESVTGTAFCLDKKIFKDGLWQKSERIEKYVEARYKFTVSDAWLERYLEHSWAMIASGAIAIELYGNQFLEYVDGSYSTIVGLPMYELREALEEIGFY